MNEFNADNDPMTSLSQRNFTKEFIFITSRSGGPGGQCVNKVSTKVELRFHVDSSVLLDEEEKSLIKQRCEKKINNEGFLRIVSQVHRTQLANKETCIEKFYALLLKCLTKPKKRIKSKPSKQSVEKRLETKKRHALIKTYRSKKDMNPY